MYFQYMLKKDNEWASLLSMVASYVTIDMELEMFTSIWPWVHNEPGKIKRVVFKTQGVLKPALMDALSQINPENYSRCLKVWTKARKAGVNLRLLRC